MARAFTLTSTKEAAVGSSDDKVLREDNLIEKVTENRLAHYEPFGWHHWPEHPWLAYQFRRGLGETQEGGGTVSECFLAASRMIPGDYESWHREWLVIGDANYTRGVEEEKRGHIRTAMNCFLRAADYYRQSEFYLPPEDPRRLASRSRTPSPRTASSPHGGRTCTRPAAAVSSTRPWARRPTAT